MKRIATYLGALLLPLSMQVAADLTAVEAAIKNNLVSNLPNLQVLSIEKSQVKDIYQVQINGGDMIHVSADGKYIFNGDLLAVHTGGLENLTEVWRSKQRVTKLNLLKDADLVVFPAKGKQKGEVIAFTDTSCGYCQKLHQEVPKMNEMGITVKYAAWPRYGLQSPAGQTMKNVWCSKDRKKNMTMAKNRQAIPEAKANCDVAVVEQQINLGKELGVRGTPALFLKDGRQVGGYLDADTLAAKLGIKE